MDKFSQLGEKNIASQEGFEEKPEEFLFRVGINYDGKELQDIIEPVTMRLPFDTLQALDFKQNEIDNLSLYLFKAAIFKDYDSKKVQSKYDPTVLDKWNNFGISEEALAFLLNRQKNQAERLFGKIFSVPIGELENSMALGLGDAAPYENGIRLHHLYGLPYIPASSLKGIVRSYLVQEHFGREQDSEAQAFHQDQGLCDIFGCPKDISFGDKKPKEKLPSFYKNSPDYDFEEKMGDVFFFDAFPTRIPRLKVDVMNPHYGPYYSSGETPADYHSPVPIFFLTVKETGFNFFFGLKQDKTITQGKLKGQKMSDAVKKAVHSALTRHGIGAKTAVGYGYFSSSENNE